MTRTKPLGVADYLASPERAVALLNRVLAGGGNLKEIRQAVAIVAGALERAGYRQAQCFALCPDRMYGPAAAPVGINGHPLMPTGSSEGPIFPPRLT